MPLERFLSLKKPATKRAYYTAIKDLESYIDSSASFCTQENAIDYISSFRKSHSDASIKHRYHLLRSYFEYLVNIGEITRNPFRIIPTLMSLRQQNQVRPTKTLKPCEVKKVLRAIDTSDLDGKLQFAFIALLFTGGLRRGEALAIRGCNVILDDISGGCRVELRHTKAGVVQFQPIPEWCAKILKQSLKLMPALNQRIFPWSEKTAYRIFKNRCLDVGINAAPHSFRAAATVLKDNGYEDREVADFLRHKTTHMVEVYDKRAKERSEKPKKCLNNFLRNK